jgi:methylated-DNA-[protein]-cysteine S-methyltransferase
MYESAFTGPLGELLAVVDEQGALRRLEFRKGRRAPQRASRNDAARCAHVLGQLAEYFEGGRREFELALAPEGTPFQQAVWSELCRVPFGSRVSYGELARRIGRPAAVRAVGAANGANPIAIVIPCHRVVGSDGSLTGYGSGLPIKQWLLDHEAGLRRLPLGELNTAGPRGPRPVS